MKAFGALAAVMLGLVGCGSGGSPAPSLSPPAPSVSGSPTSGPTNPVDGLMVCAPAQVSVTLTTDRSEYHAGQPVLFTLAISNRSNRPCHFPILSCGAASPTIMDSGGHVVYAPPTPGCPPPNPGGGGYGHPILAHHTDTTTSTWDQEVISSASCLSPHCPLAAPGVYHAAEPAGGLGVTARVDFTIVP